MNKSIKLLCYFIFFVQINTAFSDELYFDKYNNLLGNKYEINKDIFGANILLVYKDQLFSNEILSEIQKLKINLHRIPGGMHGMFFDWKTGEYSGRNGRYDLAKRPLSNVDLSYHLNLSMRVAKTINYLVNVNQDSPQKTKRLALYLKENNVNVKYWELGNEVKAKVLKNKFSDFDEYLEISKQHAEAIRSVFPDAEFGITAENRRLMFKQWNDEISNQNYFNNVIVHRYVGPGISRIKRREMARAGRQQNPAKSYRRMIKHSDPDKLMYSNKFVKKNIWITEWGSLFTKMDIQNSMGHAIWLARTFVKYLRHPNVKIANYFNLNAKPHEVISEENGKVIHRVPYYALKIISDLIHNHGFSSKIHLEGFSSHELIAQYFQSNDGSKQSLLFVNSTANDIPIEVSNIDKELSLRFIKANNYMDTNGHSMAMSNSIRNKTSEDIQIDGSTTIGKGILIPKYSILVLRN